MLRRPPLKYHQSETMSGRLAANFVEATFLEPKEPMWDPHPPPPPSLLPLSCGALLLKVKACEGLIACAHVAQGFFQVEIS